MSLRQSSNLARTLLLSALAAIPAFAANPESVSVTAQVPLVTNLSVNANSVPITFAVGDYDLSTGVATKAATGVTTFSVATNRSWTLQVRAGAANFTYTPTTSGDSSTKPVADLGFKLSSASSYTTVTTNDQTVTSGTRGATSKTGHTPTVDYQLTSKLDQDSPGSYSVTLIYTLTNS